MGDMRRISIVVLGDTEVGKTWFVRQLWGSYIHPTPKQTVDEPTKRMVPTKTRSGRSGYSIYYWDTPGDHKYQNYVKSSIDNVDGFVLMFNDWQGRTFRTVKMWDDVITKMYKKNRPPVLLLRNYMKEHKAKVKTSTIDTFAYTSRMLFDKVPTFYTGDEMNVINYFEELVEKGYFSRR